MRRSLSVVWRGLVAFWALASAAALVRCSSNPSSAPMASAGTAAEMRFLGTLPDGVPTSCTGESYYVFRSVDGLCSGGAIWFLCNGATFAEYSCGFPGPDWVEASPEAEDAGASGSISSSSPSGNSTTTSFSSSRSATSGATGASSTSSSSTSASSTGATHSTTSAGRHDAGEDGGG